MLDSEKLAIAAHLHVAMRRKLGRVTDVEWMVRSEEYACEIVRLALAEPDQPELHQLARRMRDALFAAPPPPPRRLFAAAEPAAAQPAAQPAAHPATQPAPPAPEAPQPGRYVGRLR